MADSAINKCSNTQYGKGFLRDKRYENPVANGFQISDNNFYNARNGAAQPRGFYTTSQNFANKKTYEHEYAMPIKIVETHDHEDDGLEKANKEELMAALKQSKYKVRPNSSRVRKRSQITKVGKKAAEIDEEDGMNALSKGITTNKQERDRIPIKTMFGNDEDVVERHNTKLRYEDDGGDVEGSRRTQITPQQSARRDVFLEDERSKVKDTLNTMRASDKVHQPVVKVTTQKNSRQGLNTAGPKINFQTSLSPDFLNLFAQ